ncbi:unnamed protein product, partial [Adineta steineri]
MIGCNDHYGAYFIDWIPYLIATQHFLAPPVTT